MKRPTNEHFESMERENARLRGDLMTMAKRFSHDLRTPLGGIVSAAEAVKEILAEHDPSSVVLADSLLNSADEMTQLIKQVSFLARASAHPLPKETVNMGDPVFIALQRLESRILKSGASVQQPDEWPTVPGVPSWLEMVWWQLLANALKFGGPNCRIQLGWQEATERVEFWLENSGPAVPMELQTKLFKEFNVLHQEPSIPGLGLSIVQRLVELQGGTCRYETPDSQGARFIFSLPKEAPGADRVDEPRQ